MTTITKLEVAAHFTALIAASEKTQGTIASEAGIESPNILSMIKSGKTKLPLGRIPALAKSLDADANKLFAMALEAYEPELYKVFASLAPSMLISSSEYRLIEALRATTASR